MLEFLLRIAVCLIVAIMGMALVTHAGGPEWAAVMTGWLSVTIVAWSSK